MKTPIYMLMEELVISQTVHDKKSLPAGSFVKPIHPNYLPQHIKDGKEMIWFNPESEVFAYTHYGIIIIPLKIMREA